MLVQNIMNPPKIDNIQYTWQSYYDALVVELGGVYGDNKDVIHENFKTFEEWKAYGSSIKKGEKSIIFCKDRGHLFMAWQLRPIYGGLVFSSPIEEDLGNDMSYYS